MKTALTWSLLFFWMILPSCRPLSDRGQYRLENDELKILIFQDLSVKIRDKRNSKEYGIAGSDDFIVKNAEKDKDVYRFFCLYRPDSMDMNITLSLRDSTVDIQLTADSTERMTERIFFPGSISTSAGDFLIIPYASGFIIPVNEGFFMDEFRMWQHGATMPFAGVTDMKSAYMITSGDPWDTGIKFVKTAGNTRYELQPFHEPVKGKFGHERTLHYTFISTGNYVEMGKWYRSFAKKKGYVKTLKEKAVENPNVNRLRGAVDFWLRGEKLHTAEFINQLRKFGVDKALLSLSGGWYASGKYSRLIDTINAAGFLSSRYDILTDVWPPTHPELKHYRTEGYPGDVVVEANGELYKGWVAYINKNTPFQGYIICSGTHPDYIDRRLVKELINEHYNARFMDVELSLHLLECYSLRHPTTRHSDALNRIKALYIVKNKYGLVTGSEEAYDWAFPVVDFSEGTMSVMPDHRSEYDWSTPIDDPDEDFLKYDLNPTLRIPLHGLVYHDTHVITWYTGDGLSKVPAYWDDKDLFTILYATMHLFMPPSYDYWQNNLERFLTSYHLTSPVFESAGFARMTGHKMLTADRMVQQTTFDNGWKIIVNFGDSFYKAGGKVLPSKGFYATDGKRAVFRISNDQGKLAAADLPGKLFINPYGKTVTFKGIRTDGSVVLMKEADGIRMALIGDQSGVDIKKENLPWPLSTLRASADNGSEMPLKTLEDGWYRLEKKGDQRFYRLSEQ